MQKIVHSHSIFVRVKQGGCIIFAHLALRNGYKWHTFGQSVF